MDRYKLSSRNGQINRRALQCRLFARRCSTGLRDVRYPSLWQIPLSNGPLHLASPLAELSLATARICSHLVVGDATDECQPSTLVCPGNPECSDTASVVSASAGSRSIFASGFVERRDPRAVFLGRGHGAAPRDRTRVYKRVLLPRNTVAGTRPAHRWPGHGPAWHRQMLRLPRISVLGHTLPTSSRRHAVPVASYLIPHSSTSPWTNCSRPLCRS
jgi:hypothetical protein